MKQEDKELLLKDLCARLPYGVKLDTLEGPQELDIRWLSINMCNIANPYLPYLFPLSSMTEEQKIRISAIQDMGPSYYHLLVDRYNEWHIDYRGLIPKGLANDATGLGVY